MEFEGTDHLIFEGEGWANIKKKFEQIFNQGKNILHKKITLKKIVQS